MHEARTDLRFEVASVRLVNHVAASSKILLKPKPEAHGEGWRHGEAKHELLCPGGVQLQDLRSGPPQKAYPSKHC